LIRPAQEIAASEVLEGLPRRIHEVIDRHVRERPARFALVEDGGRLSYSDLDLAVRATAEAIVALGVRPGDRVMIVSENSIALACLLLSASRIDAWAIVANPRLSPRELDQIREHSCARRVFFTIGVSKEAEVHAWRLGAGVENVGSLRNIGVSALNEHTLAEQIE
jgi:acyl-CoA synthetase (AMP-forming)/AMP-acid ligase II